MADYNWTAEKLAALDLKRLKIVKENAERKGAIDLVAKCDEEIRSRPSSHFSASPKLKSQAGDIVLEYHFDCRNDRGVTLNPDGTFWSASWVVAEDVVETSMRYGAILALHNSRRELSYRQGTIKDYRLVNYDQEGEIKSRIDLLVSSEATSLPWAGRATGEKGYKRRKISEPAKPSVSEGENQ